MCIWKVEMNRFITFRFEGDGKIKEDKDEMSLRSYLEEARGHGSTWHGVVGWHVAHDWAWRCCCALKHNNSQLKWDMIIHIYTEYDALDIE